MYLYSEEYKYNGNSTQKTVEPHYANRNWI